MANNFAVIGSGPVAYFCIEELNKQGFHVDLYAPDELKKVELNSSYYYKSFAIKQRLKQPFLFNRNSQIPEVSQLNTAFYEIYRIGGLAEVWGGVFFPWSAHQNCFNDFDSQVYRSILEEVFTKFNFSEYSDFLLNYAFDSSTTQYASIKTPIIWNHNLSKPWSPRNDLLKNSKYSLYGPAHSLEFYDDFSVRVKYFDSRDNVLESKKYDWVFVAAGPIGDAKLILNSTNETSSILVNDSKVSYSICFGKIQNYSEKMTPIAFYSKFKRNSNFSQVYAISDELIEAIKSPFLKEFMRLIKKFFKKHIAISINFHGSKGSNSFRIQKSSTNFHAIGSRTFRFKIGFPSFQFRLGIINTNFGFFAKSGSSQHIGAFIQNTTKGAVLAKDKAIKFNSVTFLGASSLSNIPTGPVTLTAVVNTIYQTRNFLARYKK